MSCLESDTEKSHEIVFGLSFQREFLVSASQELITTNSTDRDAMIKHVMPKLLENLI